jgi:hypothetical protein
LIRLPLTGAANQSMEIYLKENLSTNQTFGNFAKQINKILCHFFTLTLLGRQIVLNNGIDYNQINE